MRLNWHLIALAAASVALTAAILKPAKAEETSLPPGVNRLAVEYLTSSVGMIAANRVCSIKPFTDTDTQNAITAAILIQGLNVDSVDRVYAEVLLQADQFITEKLQTQQQRHKFCVAMLRIKFNE